jgi:hypothetical protein
MRMSLVVIKVMNYTLFMTLTYIRPHLAKNRGRASSKPKEGAAPQSRPDTIAIAAPAAFKGLTIRKPSSLKPGKVVEPLAHAKGTFLVFQTKLEAAPKLVKSTRNLNHARLTSTAYEYLKIIDINALRVLIENEIQARVGPALEARVAEEVVRVFSPLAPHQSAAMTLARERGAVYARQQYEDPHNLSLLAAAKYAGISDRVINERRNAGRYYALVLDGKSRGFRYPSWQFDADSARLTPVLDILREANASCWATHHFMQMPNSQLDGLTPRDWILDPTRDAGRAVNTARARFASDQGAG